MKITSAFSILALSIWSSAGWAADPVKIPGSRLTLVPPEGFTIAKEFAGLQGDKSSVLVVEIPAAVYSDVVSAIASGAMAKQGVEITGSEDLPGLPFSARLFRGRQVSQGVEIQKWLMLADGGTNLTMINVSAVKGAAPLTDVQVYQMFRSIRLSAAPAGNPIDALPFSVASTAGFSHRQPLAGTGLIIGSAPPTPENASRPALVISKTFEQAVPKAQWNAAATSFLTSLRAIKVDKADDPKPVKIGNLEGLEIVATGSSEGEPRKLLIVMLFAPNSGYALIGMASPKLFDAAIGDFRKMINSFQLKP